MYSGQLHLVMQKKLYNLQVLQNKSFKSVNLDGHYLLPSIVSNSVKCPKNVFHVGINLLP